MAQATVPGSIAELNDETKLKDLFSDPNTIPDPKWYRQRELGSLAGRFDMLYVYTEQSIPLIATRTDEKEGNLFVRASGQSLVTMNEHIVDIQRNSGILSDTARSLPTRYENVTLDVNTQRLLRQAGIASLNGTLIPPNPKEPLKTGARKIKPNIFSAGIFSEVQQETEEGATPDAVADFQDRRYVVTTRVPDSFSYHMEKNKTDNTIPILEKGHAPYQRIPTMIDPSFDFELAKARYLAGMEPYLDETQAKEFDHFTYWRYKQPNPNNAFQGAYVHIFITRPDLHIFDRSEDGLSMRSDVGNIPDLATIIYTHPECAASLVMRWQSKAMTDINLFLSNRACGIQLSNDQIDEHSFVEAFNKIKPTFGGRIDNSEGDIDITFNETQDLSVSNTILLWMKYIHATYTGTLSPLVNTTAMYKSKFERNMKHQHPLWRRMDSLASIYVIATDMTQRNIIFWRKYFGVYPKSTAFAGLSTDGSGKISEGVRKITIPFKYCTFRTNNMIDLYAFDCLSDLRTILNNSAAINPLVGNSYQIWDPNTTTDHDNIAGIPFVAIEQHITPEFPDYNRQFPIKMYNPQLLFSRSDGAYIPTDPLKFNRDFIARYWGNNVDPHSVLSWMEANTKGLYNDEDRRLVWTNDQLRYHDY